MSVDPSQSGEHSDPLESTRRLVRQLEIDAHLMRADLTRLEVELLDDAQSRPIARIVGTPAIPPRDILRGTRDEEVTATSERAPATLAKHDPTPSQSTAPTPTAAPSWQPAAAALPELMDIAVGVADDFPTSESFVDGPESTNSVPDFVPILDNANLDSQSELGARSNVTYRQATPPILASLLVHSVILVLCVSITVATLVRPESTLSATFIDLPAPEEAPEKLVEVEVPQAGQGEDAGLENTLAETPQLEVAGPLLDEVTPIEFASAAGPMSLGDMGLLSSLPTETGTVPVGNGGLGENGSGAPSGGKGGSRRGGGGGRRNGGPLGAADFFGTRSEGDRIVYIVDNSSSMKGGRLEMAEAELLKSVESLTPKQSFYVIFVSDQTYPMFYPDLARELAPATPANKKRLAEWLPNAILAAGKNRELIKAVNLAASLEPQAIFLLWDGDLRYSESVRMDVMNHLAGPSPWKFAIHTFGMGVTSLDNEANLSAIAQAHGGTYRRINLPKQPAR